MRIRYSRRHALAVVAAVTVVLLLVLAVLSAVEPRTEYVAIFARIAIYAIAAVWIATVVLNLIGEAVERSTHQRF